MPVIPVVAAAVFVRRSLPTVSISACSVLALVFALSYCRSPRRRAQAKRSPEDKAVQKTLTGVSLLLVVLAFLKK